MSTVDSNEAIFPLILYVTHTDEFGVNQVEIRYFPNKHKYLCIFTHRNEVMIEDYEQVDDLYSKHMKNSDWNRL